MNDAGDQTTTDSDSTAVSHFECQSCGAALTYAPGTTQLKCPYCGNVNEIAAEPGGAVEHDLGELALVPATSARGLGGEGRTFKCSNCGATTNLPPGVASTACAFCGSEVVVQTASDPDLVRPETLVPFEFDKRQAAQKFRDWIRRLWFRPNNLKKVAALEEMNGVYTPFFTYDAQATSDWRGEAGDYYWETETYYDPQEKKQKTRQVRKTRWTWRSGRHQALYDDHLVCASTGLEGRLVRTIEPFDLSGLRPYKEAFLSGWSTEEYSLDPHSAWATAQDELRGQERETCSRELGGDTQRSLQVDTRFSDVTWKHLLLPVFVASYRYAGKRYHFLINGQTGEVAGQAPLSWWKILGAVLAAAAIAAAVYFVREGLR
ncbi:MAG: hypothetical protein COZ06_26015 [Armatimonadetes bacterium CG_4_10_14_3_um_filter_66_18]|nr:MAG: hypothetical protein COZ06_26015 [Armatimonadetes bacterium CG_4_10_14_3_um_filter_66_18]